METLNKKLMKIILAATISSVVIIAVVYIYLYKILFNQEVEKARLLAKTLVFTRDYIAKQAPHIKVVNTNNPFLCTPAYVADKVSERVRNNLGFYIKQVSDRYRNPLDKPTSFELKLINKLKKNPHLKDTYALQNINGNKYLIYAYPLKTEKSCLLCHGVPYKDVPAPIYKQIVKRYGNKAFNYKLGELRGIISIKENYSNIIAKINKIFFIVAFLLFIAFLLGIYLFYRFNDFIRKEISVFIQRIKMIKEGKFAFIKDKMHFEEFERLRDEFNELIKNIKKFQREIYKDNYYNKLTLLPNRRKLDALLEKKDVYSVAIVDIDKFKEINAMFGMEEADKLIKQVAIRLNSIKHVYGFKIFHIDIDQFVLLFKRPASRIDLKKVLETILHIIEEPYEVDGNEIVVKFKMGASYRGNLVKAIMALDAADMIKKDIVFEVEIDTIQSSYKDHIKWLRELKRAMEYDEIVPFFQPIVDRNKQVIKYESLVRLIDSNNKVVSPYFFLDIAKKARLYPNITKLMIEKSLLIFEKKPYGVSINLSLEDFENVEIKQLIIKMLKTYSDPTKITFEIVESEEIRDNNEVLSFIKELKSYGVQIYIDDFGSGYANFDYLFKLNADGIKIDGTLIKNILTDKNSETIVRIIVEFAKQAGMKTVAEFVENEEVFQKLKEMGIDYFQGYYFSPPIARIEG